MDKAIFFFDAAVYTRESVEKMTRSLCEHLCNVDDENVLKIDLECDSLQECLNDNVIDVENNWVRCFIIDEDNLTA